MQHDAPEYIEVKYYTACQSSSKEVKESSKCDDLMIGEEVEFKVQIKVLRCPDNPSAWKQMFKIFPIGSQESIHINLEMNCDCSCEHQEYHVSNTSFSLKFAMKRRLTLFFYNITLVHAMAICSSSILDSSTSQAIMFVINGMNKEN
jgi:hypothetical protein